MPRTSVREKERNASGARLRWRSEETCWWALGFAMLLGWVDVETGTDNDARLPFCFSLFTFDLDNLRLARALNSRVVVC